MSGSHASSQWKQLLDGCCSTQLGPIDSEVASGKLSSASPSSPVSITVDSITDRAKKDEQCQGGPLSPEALQEVQALLDRLDPTSPSSSTFLLAVLTAFKLAPPYLAAHALSNEGSWKILDSLMQLHKRSRNLGSMPSQLVVALVAFLAGSCEAASLPSDPLSSRPSVSEALISHLVFLAPRAEDLHTPRGLATVARALRTLFALSTSGTAPGRALGQLCQQADVPGRILQALAHDTSQLLHAASSNSSGTLSAHQQQQQQQEVAELYVQLLAAGVAYLGFSSGLFSAPGGRRVLDGPSQRPSRAWLLVPGRLQALGRPLQDAAALAFGSVGNNNRGPAEAGSLKPESKNMAGGALRNLMMTLALPMCTSKSQDDVVELMEFAMRFSHSLYEAGYVGLLQGLVQSATHCLATAPAEAKQLATFVGAASGSLLRAVEVIGGRLNVWGVKLQRPSTLSSTGPEFGCDLTFPSDGGKDGVSAAEAQAFIQENIGFVLDVGNELLAAVQLANA